MSVFSTKQELDNGINELRENVISKGKEVIAYKGMEFNMTCKGFQYEVGKSYKIDKAELCYYGFHACLNPKDVLKYYSGESPRYFKVKLSGEVEKCGKYCTQVAATEITILEEINIDEVIKTTEWWKNENVIDLLYFSDGLSIVQRSDSLYNFIDKQGNCLFNDWFNWVENFREGFAVVQRGDCKANFIDKNGNYLSDEWFHCAGNFFNGFAVVRRANGEYNLIDKNGNYLFDKWYKYVGNFYDGFAKVQKTNGEWNFIDKKGNYLSNEWFNNVHYFREGFAVVQRVVDEKYNFINKKGNYLSDEWFSWVNDFKEGLAIVKRTNGEWAKIDKTGKIVISKLVSNNKSKRNGNEKSEINL